MSDSLHFRWGSVSVPSTPADTPAEARVKEAKRNLAEAEQAAKHLIFTTPVPTETIVVPIPIRCHFCELRPAATYTRIEDGKVVHYYEEPGFVSSYPLCAECKDSLERSHFDGMSC